MRQQLVYDLPTRLFHWIFTGLFSFAFLIAKVLDDDSPFYSYHMLAGFTLGFVVLLRIVWGIFGTSHAKFTGFALNPLDLINYFKNIISGDKVKWAGHNPASSWAGLAMMALALSLGISGYLMTSGGNKESIKEVHELLANAFILIVIMHIAGIILHSMRFKDAIALSMIDGKKSDIDQTQTISSSKPVVGLFFIAFVLAFALNLFKNYNSQNQTLNFFGTTLQLGENEENEGGAGEQKRKGEKDSENDKDDDD